MARPYSGYKNKAGAKVPGVTTILGRFKESGALLQWAFSQGQAFERGEIKGLYDKRDEAADIGTQVHEIVECHMTGMPYEDPTDPRVISGFEAYLKWQEQTRLKFVATELPLVSEQYQFGGTFDFIAEIDGELCLGDVKTSKGVYSDFLCQLAAYDILWHENYPDRPLTGGFHLCKFSKQHGDFSHHYWPNLDDAREQFLLLRRAYDLDKELKARAS